MISLLLGNQRSTYLQQKKVKIYKIITNLMHSNFIQKSLEVGLRQVDTKGIGLGLTSTRSSLINKQPTAQTQIKTQTSVPGANPREHTKNQLRTTSKEVFFIFRLPEPALVPMHSKRFDYCRPFAGALYAHSPHSY